MIHEQWSTFSIYSSVSLSWIYIAPRQSNAAVTSPKPSSTCTIPWSSNVIFLVTFDQQDNDTIDFRIFRGRTYHDNYILTETTPFRRNSHPRPHWKLSFGQTPVQPVTKTLSGRRHSRFSDNTIRTKRLTLFYRLWIHKDTPIPRLSGQAMGHHPGFSWWIYIHVYIQVYIYVCTCTYIHIYIHILTARYWELNCTWIGLDFSG